MRADSTASCPPLVTSQDGSCLLSDTAVKLPSGGSLFGGTKGSKGMKHFLLGSTAEKVARHAPCPVLIVREKERAFI